MTRRLFAATLFLLALNGPAAAQLPRVGSIDFYGLRRLKPEHLAAAIGIQIGDTIAATHETASATIRDRLLQVPGVADADVSLVCCDTGRMLMYVGVREVGAPALTFRAAPTGPQLLPVELMAAEHDFLRELMEAVRRNQAEEDASAGHSLMKYPPARAVQEKFISYARGHEALLKSVLHNSAESEHRAVAAQVLAYASDKNSVIADLTAAARDPDADVRNNAIRALGIMAAAGHEVPFDVFIELLTSVDWTDRNKASFVLTALTADRDARLLANLRQRALESLVEMARWRSLGHAAAAGIILGRIAGLPEDEIFPGLLKDREQVIRAALKSR